MPVDLEKPLPESVKDTADRSRRAKLAAPTQPPQADSSSREPERTNTSLARRLLLVFAIGPGTILCATLAITLPWRWVAPPTTSFILIKGAREGVPERRWVRWRDISPNIAIAVIAAEDQKFAFHRGFDVDSIRETLTDPVGIRRGASTISQQVAKNLYLWPGRSWVRKGLEAYLTVFIEALWPKKRILEVYLNVVEFGPGVYGVAAASRAYFGTSPQDLSPYQAALLTAVLPNPHRMSVVRPSAYVRGRALWILNQSEQLGGESYLAKL